MSSNFSNPNFLPDRDGEHHLVFPNNNTPDQDDDKGYALSGKIMLSAIVILFFVVILMVCLHLYARWYLLRRRHSNRRNRRNRNHLVFQADNNSAAANRGLDAAILSSIPVFVFKNLAPRKGSDSDSCPSPPIECAVCLSEFEEGETGRKLPRCGHCFHIDCIDMWFHSHSTCPLCRSPVEPGSDPEVRIEVGEPEPGPVCEASLAGLCSVCEAESSSSSSSSSSEIEARRKKKPVSVSILVPGRTGSFGGGDDCESPAVGQTSSFRSPMNRMLSFKSRMLSSFRSPSAATSSSVNESDLERGKDGTQGTRRDS